MGGELIGRVRDKASQLWGDSTCRVEGKASYEVIPPARLDVRPAVG
jgi:hypothetical protein